MNSLGSGFSPDVFCVLIRPCSTVAVLPAWTSGVASDTWRFRLQPVSLLRFSLLFSTPDEGFWEEALGQGRE